MDLRVSITLLFCSVVLCKKHNARRTGARTTTEKLFYLPDIPKHFLDENFKIPSEQFCSEVQLKPADQYFLLPWWYHYCQRLQEARIKKVKNLVFTNMPLFKKVLEKVKKFKKQISDHPVEIPAYRDIDVNVNKYQPIPVYRPMARRSLHRNRGRQYRFLEHQ